MSPIAVAGLDVAELQRTLRRVEPGALLVAPRILRRVIKQDRQIAGAGLLVPHRKSYCVARDSLLRWADRRELGVAADQVDPLNVDS